MAASEKSVVVSSATDLSSDCTLSDDWQELTKSDYAKVIFSDLLCNATDGTVECKFQITDNVHEDPNDYVGLFRIGFDDLSQCLVSKMLSQTKCEDDGKLQRCVFTSSELPCLDDGFYQFLYVTRDQEVCGASMPFQIKMSPPQLKESSVESSSSENTDGGFILVSNETEKKEKEESSEPIQPAAVQQSPLSEQKKEEIAAWVSQNPDYYSLIEQIKEHTFTIDALQQSKDLAMKEVAQLYEIINTQSSEVTQLKNMLAAYEEKMKISQSLHDEKNNELIEAKNKLATRRLINETFQKQLERKIVEQASKEKNLYEELCVKKNYLLLLEEKLAKSTAFQHEQQIEITNLKRELEEMQKAKDCQVSAKIGKHSMDDVIQKAQNLVYIVNDTLKNFNFTDENAVDKFFCLRIQILIILNKMSIAAEQANISDSHGRISCVTENKVTEECHIDPPLLGHKSRNTPIVELKSIPLINATPVLKTIPQTKAPVVEKPVLNATSLETPPLPDSNETESSNEDASTAVAEIISSPKSLESEALEHQIIELPRLDVINEETAKTLQRGKLLVEEDITVMNRLTEKIIKRGCNLYEAIESVDDSASDSESEASEISECSTFFKKDLICVSRVMEALASYLSNQTSLDHLIVVEKEEDKNLIHRNKWDVLLQKCALRYQIELFLEHIEKQREGIKKVSEKICDLLTKCMLLKDEVSESKADCGRLQSVIETKDAHIFTLKRELKFKDDLLSIFQNREVEFEKKTDFAERSIEDFRSRIVEASKIYKEQFIVIRKLNKEIKKLKSMKNKTKSSKEESPSISSESSKTASSFEVVKKDSVQNINDSDTGEHTCEKALLVSKEGYSISYKLPIQVMEDPNTDERHLTPPASTTACCYLKEPSSCASSDPIEIYNEGTSISCKLPIQVIEDPNTDERCLTPPASTSTHPFLKESCVSSDSHKDTYMGFKVPIKLMEDPNTGEIRPTSPASLSAGVAEWRLESDPSLAPHEDIGSYESFQEIIKEGFASMKNPDALRNSEGYLFPCFLCKEFLFLCPGFVEDLMNHLEHNHSMKICPVCGQLFEDAVPSKYYQIHVEKHFETQ